MLVLGSLCMPIVCVPLLPLSSPLTRTCPHLFFRLALHNHSNDRSTVISVLKSLQKMVQLPTSQGEVDAALAVFAKEREAALLLYEEEQLQQHQDKLEQQRLQAEKESEEFWNVDHPAEKKEEHKQEEEEQEQASAADDGFQFKPMLPAARLFSHDSFLAYLTVALEQNDKDDGVVCAVFEFLFDVLVSLRGIMLPAAAGKGYVDHDNVERGPCCEDG